MIFIRLEKAVDNVEGVDRIVPSPASPNSESHRVSPAQQATEKEGCFATFSAP